MASTTTSATLLLGASCALVAGWFSACSDAHSAPLPASPEPVEATPAQDDGRTGAEVYQQLCALCHGETGDGVGLIPLDRPARSFLEGHFSFGNTREALFRTVTAGIGGTPMPGFGEALTDAEIYRVVDHIIAMGPEREPVATKSTIMHVTDKPLVVRGGFPELAEGEEGFPRGLLLGGLDGLAFQYDAQDVQLVAVRQGEFVERRDWENRGGDTLKPLGQVIHRPLPDVGHWYLDDARLTARLRATEVGSQYAFVEYELVPRRAGLTLMDEYDFTAPEPAVATVREHGHAISRGGWSGYRRVFAVSGAEVRFDAAPGTPLAWPGATLREHPDVGALVIHAARTASPRGAVVTVDLYFGLAATPENLKALQEAL